VSASAGPAGATRRAPDESAVPVSIPASSKDAFDALDAAGVAWCLLRGADELADQDGDVDLLIAPGDIERAARALEGIDFIEHRAWGYEPHRFFLRMSDAGRSKLDLVDDLRFGPAAGVRVPALAGALERRRHEGGLPRLAPADEFWALLLHALLDKPSVEERHRLSLRRLALAGREAPLAGLFRSSTDAEAIIDAVENDRWVEAAAWAKTLSPGARRAGVTRALVRRLGWRMPPLRRRGVTVALLAPDGAGKTTIVELLAGSFPIPVRSIYMGLYKNPRRRLPPGIGLGGRVGLQWGRYARAVYHRLRGRVVLFDRYTDDAALPSGTATGTRERIRRRVLAGALPRPDLILVLDAPAEELLRRKGEHDLEKLERDRRHYLAVAHASPRAAVLDATRPPEDVARAAAARIWAVLAARS
jgi:thymidylate kinase